MLEGLTKIFFQTTNSAKIKIIFFDYVLVYICVYCDDMHDNVGVFLCSICTFRYLAFIVTVCSVRESAKQGQKDFFKAKIRIAQTFSQKLNNQPFIAMVIQLDLAEKALLCDSELQRVLIPISKHTLT